MKILNKKQFKEALLILKRNAPNLFLLIGDSTYDEYLKLKHKNNKLSGFRILDEMYWNQRK